MSNHKPTNGPRSIPGINVRELVEDRNWPALGGLGLIGLGILYLIQDLTGMDINIWSILLVAIGGWLAYDGYQTYQSNGNRWTDVSRNRAIAGGVIAFIGFLGMTDISGFSTLLLLIAGLLGYDAWHNYEKNGRVWTDRARSRMTGAVIIGGIALLGIIDLWSTWPVVLIVLGVAMLFGFAGKNR